MIAFVSGPVAALAPTTAVIEVGGIGMAVQCTPNTLSELRIGQEARLATSLVVREDSLTLYGFADAAARELFMLLQTVSGVGPRLALAMLAVLEPDTLRAALADGNTAVLTQVPGIGRKGAERLVVELRDKVTAVAAVQAASAGQQAAPPSADQVRGQVTEALVGLGFAARVAEQAVDAVLAENGDREVPQVLRSALTRLGRTR
jgi:holliday junction DNA helicase RuvA